MQEKNRDFEILVPASPVESVNIKNGRYLFDIELFFEFESMLFAIQNTLKSELRVF